MLASAAEVVTLRGGVTVALDVLQLLWSLERRGFRLRAEGDSLIVNPKAQLTATDADAIRLHLDELLMLVKYCEAIN